MPDVGSAIFGGCAGCAAVGRPGGLVVATVRFEAVTKRYGNVSAVRSLNLICPQGEMLALLGPSGCGKSSTLKMVAGIEAVTEGEIYFDDRPVSALTPGARDIAMVFEDYALYPHLSARDNIAFPLSVRGVPAKTAAERVASVIDLLGLGGMAGDTVRDLSGGAQQRISIGRALVRDPELILFDEPLSHLDGDQKVQLRAEIKRLQQTAHLTSILVTHDQSEAIAMADRVAVMNDGVLQQVATPAELYARPANEFVANFIGEPPMNLLSATVEGEEGAPVLVGAGWQAPLNGGTETEVLRALRSGERLTVGIRPEHVAIAPPGAGPSGFEARVAAVEPRGDSDILTLQLGTERVTAEVDGPSRWRSGERARVALPAEALHLFCGECGHNLRRAA